MVYTGSKKSIIALSWILVFMWMGMIFTLSSQPAVESASLSRGITEVVIEMVERMVPSVELNIESFDHVVRKNAHLIVYLILGILVSQAFSMNGLHGRENARHTIMICVLYAVSDEVHQMLVPGRGPSIIDIFIDGMGATAGLLLYYLAQRGGKKALFFE